jgi:signal transduction histidine kinase
LNEVIDKAIQVVENQLRFKRIKINTRFDTQLPEITLDVNQVQQVYINLMLNAGDAISDAGGEINISTAVIHQSLYGNQQIKQASCGRNHSLIDEENKIGGMPSIKVKVITESEEGYINIDPIYGKHRSQYDITYTKNNLVQILCPECEMSLVDESETCPHCLSPLYSITIPSYGVLKGCTKFGCHWQKWEIIDRIGEIQYVISDVADSGCGIAEGEMIKIFEPFYTTKAIRGTGLGLSVVWGIINNHGGTISVKSEENKGTIFTIKLPVEQII